MDLTQRFGSQNGIYLLNHSVGLPPDNTRENLDQKLLDPWINNDPKIWDHWLGAVEDFRHAVSSLLGGESKDYCPQSNVSSALVKILFSLESDLSGKSVLLSEKAFPSMGFVFQAARQLNLKRTFVPVTHDLKQPSQWIDRIDRDTALVLLTHVHSNTNERSPVQEVVDYAKSRGIVTVVDIAQSAGVLPIDVAQWDADFVMGSCLKWLCGGAGAGFIWVNPRILYRCEPQDVGWFSHENPFEFDIHDFRYATDALRFWGGTPAIAPYVIATNSLRLFAEAGVQTVREHNNRLTQQLAEIHNQRPVLVSPIEPQHRGGTLVFDFHQQQDAVIHALRDAGVHFDGRADGFRLSPHIYNTRQQMQTVYEVLERFV